jgi:hypothetical protein
MCVRLWQQCFSLMLHIYTYILLEDGLIIITVTMKIVEYFSPKHTITGGGIRQDDTSFVLGRMVPKEVVGRNISANSPVNYVVKYRICSRIFRPRVFCAS